MKPKEEKRFFNCSKFEFFILRSNFLLKQNLKKVRSLLYSPFKESVGTDCFKESVGTD